jgi:hypothetical protein
MEIGRVEGRVEGQQEAAIRILKRQLGQLSEATTKRIKRLPLEKVEELLDAFPDFQNKAELNRWLSANAPKQRAALNGTKGGRSGRLKQRLRTNAQ